MIKKTYKFIISLKFAIILFLLIATYSIIGTVLPQGLPIEYYIENHGSLSKVIDIFTLNNVYKSSIFRFLNLLFIVNLVGCTLNILPSQLHRMKREYYPLGSKDKEDLLEEGLDPYKFKEILKAKRYKIIEKEDYYLGYKHKIGNIGSSVTHLAIVIIILGSFLGGIFEKEGYINLMPGDIKAFEDKGFAIKLEDFYLDFRDNDSIEQYYSEISILEDNKEIKKEKMWVNKPIKYKGINFYQSNYGWASRVDIESDNGEILNTCVLKNGDSCFYKPLNLQIYLYGFYPDLHIIQGGEPVNLSEKKNNPYYAVMIYRFKEVVGSYVVEAGQVIEEDGVKITFVDSELYTGLTYNEEFGYSFIIIGSSLLIMGLLLSFYFYPKFVFVKKDQIYVSVRQNQWGFTQVIKRYLKLADKEGE